MKVYCVVNVDDEYGFHDLVAVFSTREKADEHIDKLCVNGPVRMVGEPAQYSNFSHNSGLWIEEMEVDPA